MSKRYNHNREVEIYIRDFRVVTQIKPDTLRNAEETLDELRDDIRAREAQLEALATILAEMKGAIQEAYYRLRSAEDWVDPNWKPVDNGHTLPGRKTQLGLLKQWRADLKKALGQDPA